MWGGGDTLLVQLGDVVDRGPHSLALLVLLERLKVGAWGSAWVSARRRTVRARPRLCT